MTVSRSIAEITRLLDQTTSAITRARNYLLSLQHPYEGYWWAELQANVSITAEYILLHKILGTAEGRPMEKAAQYLLAEQTAEGGWELFYGGGGELSTSIEAYLGLKLMGLPADAAPMRRARNFILGRGGVSKSRVFTKLHLALIGSYDWQGVPSIPAWFMLLPRWFPGNIYDMSSWARSSTVPLSLVTDRKPIFRLDPPADVDELYSEGRGHALYAFPREDRLFSQANFFVALDRLFKLAERVSLVPFRQRGLRAAERWTLAHQETTGDWGGIIPGMLNSILGLFTIGYPPDHPVIARGLAAIDRFGIEEADRFRVQPCISPVWDTGLAITALVDAGVPTDHPMLQSAGQWLLSKQVLRYGDWAMKNREGKPGGWAFEFTNHWFPDVDDTAVVIMALDRLGLNNEAQKCEACRLGIEWVLTMQCSQGGWAAFDKNNNGDFLNRTPYGDLKAMIDPNTADLTGRVLEMLGQLNYPKDSPVVQRAIRFLRRQQEPEGCWYGRWGVNYIYGTSIVLAGLRALGLPKSEPWVRKAATWLMACQNQDGGWGETCQSYVDPSLKGKGVSTPSQTAWALIGLMASGDFSSEPVQRGIAFLLDRQNADGSWPEREFTGTGFPGHFYINYHLYRNNFPLTALGRYARHYRDHPGESACS